MPAFWCCRSLVISVDIFWYYRRNCTLWIAISIQCPWCWLWLHSSSCKTANQRKWELLQGCLTDLKSGIQNSQNYPPLTLVLKSYVALPSTACDGISRFLKYIFGLKLFYEARDQLISWINKGITEILLHY